MRITCNYDRTCGSVYEYFGGKLLKNAQGWVNQDRLGSVGKFFPYGQERPSATTNGTEKFATYFRDSETGLDYAQNRYHSSGDGRFLSPDPYQASGGPADPGSWNRYAYVGGDPVNFNDASGLQQKCVEYGNDDGRPLVECFENGEIGFMMPERNLCSGDSDVWTLDGQDCPPPLELTLEAPGQGRAFNYGQALGAWEKAKSDVNPKLFDKGCINVMKALDISETEWTSAAKGLVFADALSTTNVTMSALYAGSGFAPPAYAANWSVAQYVSTPTPSGDPVGAVASINGSNIVYINFNATTPSDVFNNVTKVLHESLHTFFREGDGRVKSRV